MSLWCWMLVVFLRSVNGQSPGSEINSNTSLYVVDIAQDELLNPILASFNPFIHLSRRPVLSQSPISTVPLPLSTSIITSMSPNLTILTFDQTPIVRLLTEIETNWNLSSVMLTPIFPDFVPLIPMTASSQYFSSSSMEPVLTTFHSTMQLTFVPMEMSTNFTFPVFISPTRITIPKTLSSTFVTPVSTVQMQLDDGTTFPPTTPSVPVVNDTRLVIRPLRPVQTVIPVRVTSATSRLTTTQRSSPTTTRTSTTTSATTTTPVATTTMFPVQELLRIVVTQPRWDRTNPLTNTYRSRMEAGLLKTFQEGDRRYVLLKEQEMLLIDNSTNATIPEADIVYTLKPVSNVTIVHVNMTSINGSSGTQMDFVLLYRDNEFGSEWNVLNAYEGLERVNLLSNDEISAILGNLVLQRPVVVSAEANVIANSTHSASPSVSSPDYYGIIVGLSTVAAVLLAVCLVWLLLCIWIRCIRKPPKTVPAAMSHHFTATQTSLALLRPEQSQLKDQGIQTMVMPRKKSLVPSQILEQLNSLDVRRTKETSFIQKSFSDKQPPADRAAAPRSSQVAPLAKTQPLREKPVANEEPVRKPPREPREAVQSEPEDAGVKSGGGRVKLVSVIKTNHMDSNLQNNVLDRRKSESPRSRLLRIRSGQANGGYESEQRSPQYKRTVGEIKRELRQWENGHI